MAIVLVAKEAESAPALLEWSWTLAKYRNEALIVLVPQRASDSIVEDIELGDVNHSQDDVLATLMTKGAECAADSLNDPEPSPLILRKVQGPTAAYGSSEIQRVEPSLLISPARWGKSGEERSIGSTSSRVRCPMMALSGGLTLRPKNLWFRDKTMHSREAFARGRPSEATHAQVTLVRRSPRHGGGRRRWSAHTQRSHGRIWNAFSGTD